jgi:hypothetical protein
MRIANGLYVPVRRKAAGRSCLDKQTGADRIPLTAAVSLDLPPAFQQPLVGASNARQQGAHMLPGLPRAGTIRGLNTISPGLLCSVKVTSISQDCA